MNKLAEWISETKGKIKVLEDLSNSLKCENCKRKINEELLPILVKELQEYELCLEKII